MVQQLKKSEMSFFRHISTSSSLFLSEPHLLSLTRNNWSSPDVWSFCGLYQPAKKPSWQNQYKPSDYKSACWSSVLTFVFIWSMKSRKPQVIPNGPSQQSHCFFLNILSQWFSGWAVASIQGVKRERHCLFVLLHTGYCVVTLTE